MLRKKSRGSDPDNSYISYIVLCDGRYLGRIFYTDAGVPKDAAGFGVSNFTSGKDARARSKTTLRTEAAMRSGNVGEPTGRANLVAKSPAVANGRADHARSSFSYAARIVTARPVAEVDYCSETWSEWQDLNLTLSDASAQHRRLTIAKTAFYLSGFVHSDSY